MKIFSYLRAICAFVFVNGAALAAPGRAYGHGRAPAPEMGASLIGLAMVVALIYYVIRRRPQVHA